MNILKDIVVSIRWMIATPFFVLGVSLFWVGSIFVSSDMGDVKISGGLRGDND